MGFFRAYIVDFSLQKSHMASRFLPELIPPTAFCGISPFGSKAEEVPFCPQKTHYRPISGGKFRGTPCHITYLPWPDPTLPTLHTYPIHLLSWSENTGEVLEFKIDTILSDLFEWKSNIDKPGLLENQTETPWDIIWWRKIKGNYWGTGIGCRFASNSSIFEIYNEKKNLDLFDHHNFSDYADHLHSGGESPVRDLRETNSRFLQSIFGETILFRPLSWRRFAQMYCLRQTGSKVH